MKRPLPFRRSYWVVPGRFLAGAFPGSTFAPEADARAEALATCGITLSVSLMLPAERDHRGDEYHPYELSLVTAAEERGRVCRCVRFPIVNGGIPRQDEMVRILDVIDSELAGGGRVYLHCWDGRGRTGTVVACWLVRHAVALPSAAVAHLQRLVAHAADWFQPAPENDLQRQYVSGWDANAGRLPPPAGYESWLAYAIATMDVRSLENDHDSGLQPQWPVGVTREAMRASATAELVARRARQK